MTIDYPLLRTFQVSDSIVEFLNKKIEEYKDSHESSNEITEFSNYRWNSGFQSGNLLNWEDEEYREFLDNQILELISNHLSIPKSNLTYAWNNILEYIDGGKMGPHNHCHNEDFVIFIYLSTCNSGDTVFYLNNYDQNSIKRTTINIRPQKNKAAIFSSIIFHEGKFTDENKKIFVAGVKINSEGYDYN